MIISQNGAVDLIPEYNRALRPIFCVSEGDANSRTINLTVTSAGEVFTIPEGAEVYVAGKKQDNTIFTYQCAYSGYIVSFPVAEQMSAANGLVLCELQIVVAGDPLGSANFCYWVEPSPIANGSSSESDLNIFEQAIAALGGYEYLTSEVSVLSARMDQFARLPDGSLSTAADAELVDIRVQADGSTASTAGDAVRAQVADIKNNIGDVLDCTIDAPYSATVNVINGGLNAIGANYNFPNNTRVRTTYIALTTDDLYCVDVTNTEYAIERAFVYETSTQGSMIKEIPLVNRHMLCFKAEGTIKYFRCSFVHSADVTVSMTDADIAAILSSLEIRVLTDKSLTVSGVAADSKATGDRISSVNADLDNKIDEYGAFTRTLNLYDVDAASDALLTSNGGTVSNASWKTTDYIPVVGDETICFQGDILTTGMLNSVYYACYSDIGVTSQNRQALPITRDADHWDFNIPACNYIRISYLTAQFANVMVSEGSGKKEYRPYIDIKDDLAKMTDLAMQSIYVSIANETLMVRTMYGATKDIVVKFGKHNANNLPDFWQFYTADNANNYVGRDFASIIGFLTVSTDWHGPFIMNAVENADGDNTGGDIFTGGNHPYNNLPTAICTDLEYYVDGRKVTTFTGLARNIEIRWKNSVQASNTVKSDGTGRNVLTESHKIVFDGVKWESSVDLEMLESVNILTYYGYQFSGVNSVYQNFRFIGGTNLKEYTNTGAHDCGGKLASTIIAHGDSHKIVLNVDTAYGLGKRDYCNGTRSAFSTNNGNKLYMWLINGATFETGDIISAKGSYQFMPV